jgi:hypothetical protein
MYYFRDNIPLIFTYIVVECGGEDVLEAGEDPDERLLDVVNLGEEVHCLAQLVCVRFHRQLHHERKTGFITNRFSSLVSIARIEQKDFLKFQHKFVLRM